MSAMMTLAQPNQNTLDGSELEPRLEGQPQPQPQPPCTIVAREGTELANALRAGGWRVRAGWRGSDADGESVWHFRFERPDERVC
jgi:hypothetical protein